MTFYWVLSVSLGFVSNLIYTRFLNPDIFGNFALTRTLVTFLPLLSLFGLHKGLLRQGSIALGRENEGLYDQIRNYTISVAMIIGFSVGFITLLGADIIAADVFKKPELATQIRFFSFVIPTLVTSNMVMSLYQVNKMADTGQFLYQVVLFSLLLLIFLLFTLFMKGEPLITWSFFRRPCYLFSFVITLPAKARLQVLG
jgi:O-antigen/teichoic acid export membrane protein